MDLKEKIQRLKELRQRNKELNIRIKNHIHNSVKGKKANVDNTYLEELKREIMNEHLLNSNKIPKSLQDYFKEQNENLYIELEQEVKRKEYIENILKLSNCSSNSYDTINDNIDNMNNISEIKRFANSLLEKKQNITNSITDNNIYNNSYNRSDISDVSNISSSSSSNLTSEIEELLSDEELYLTDSETEEDNTIFESSQTTTNQTTTNQTITNQIKTINTNALITKVNKLNKEQIKHNEQLQSKQLQDNINFLKNAPEHIKSRCFEYLKEYHSKLMKIIKVYLVRSRNNFMCVSDDVININLFGYKHINYITKIYLPKGTLIKMIFIYDGIVEIKDFVIKGYNKKNRKFEVYYCNIIEDKSNNQIIINKSKTKINVNPQWITFSRVNPEELIQKIKLQN